MPEVPVELPTSKGGPKEVRNSILLWTYALSLGLRCWVLSEYEKVTLGLISLIKQDFAYGFSLLHLIASKNVPASFRPIVKVNIYPHDQPLLLYYAKTAWEIMGQHQYLILSCIDTSWFPSSLNEIPDILYCNVNLYEYRNVFSKMNWWHFEIQVVLLLQQFF